jgi:16S rRNA (cytosine1407-C5)-methyltransferase
MNVLNEGILHHKGELLSKIYDNYFDKILVDAPCSGLGIIQKKEEVSDWWNEEKVEGLGELQLKLLVAAIKMLKTGGELVYSTCTLTVEENEFVINKVLNKYPAEIADINMPVKAHEGFTGNPGLVGEKFSSTLSKARRILPWEVDSEGFFIAKLIKTGKTVTNEPANLRQKAVKFLSHNQKEIKNKLKKLSYYFGIDEEIFSSYKFLIKGNDIFFTNNDWQDGNPGNFERIGTKFGSFDKKEDIILHTQAAQILEKHINKNVFEIDEQSDLKKYFEGGVIKKNFGEASQCLIKYKDFILGSGVNTTSGIKSRFPRAKRTQEIYTDF